MLLEGCARAASAEKTRRGEATRKSEARVLPKPGDIVCAGLDMGLRADSSALVIVHRREDVLIVAEVLEFRPTEGRPLKPSSVVRSFAKVLIQHGCSYAVGDNHYRESVAEHLNEFNLTFVPGPSSPAEAYVRSRALMRDGRVRLPNHPRLLQQLREVHGKPTSGGGMSIVHPRWSTGGHGDLAAALVLALWQVSGDTIAAPPPKVGTKEWEAEAKRARYEHFQQQEDRPHRIAKGGSVGFAQKHRRAR